jgi:hypothetical protein
MVYEKIFDDTIKKLLEDTQTTIDIIDNYDKKSSDEFDKYNNYFFLLKIIYLIDKKKNI